MSERLDEIIVLNKNFRKFRWYVGFYIFVAVIIIAPLFVKFIFAPDPMESRRGSPYFAADVRLGDIFPECGEKESSACSQKVYVIADAPKKSILMTVPVPHEIFRLLPRPLLSSAIFIRSSAVTTRCSVLELITELKNAKQISTELGGMGYISKISRDGSACLVSESSIAASRSIILLAWNNGKINGWFDCIVKEDQLIGCNLNFSREARDFEPDAGPVGEITTSIVVAEAVPMLLRKLGSVEERLYEAVTSKRDFFFDASIPGNIILWDDETQELLKNVMEKYNG